MGARQSDEQLTQNTYWYQLNLPVRDIHNSQLLHLEKRRWLKNYLNKATTGGVNKSLKPVPTRLQWISTSKSKWTIKTCQLSTRPVVPVGMSRWVKAARDPELAMAMVMAIAPPNFFRDYFCIFIKYNKYKAAAYYKHLNILPKRRAWEPLNHPTLYWANNRNYNTGVRQKEVFAAQHNLLPVSVNPLSLPMIHPLLQYSQSDRHTCQNWNNAFWLQPQDLRPHCKILPQESPVFQHHSFPCSAAVNLRLLRNHFFSASQRIHLGSAWHLP